MQCILYIHSKKRRNAILLFYIHFVSFFIADSVGFTACYIVFLSLVDHC